MGSRILVTGGTGYIGSHTVIELQRAGYKVLIVDSLQNSYLDVLQGIEKITGVAPDFVQADLRSKTSVEELLNKYNDINGIIHFAAFKAVGESVEKPLDYYENNIISLLHLLREATNRGIKNFVFSSSCTVYGQPDELPVTEMAPTKKPESPYGNTKKIAEEIIRDTAAAYSDINFISLRYFNPIGAHPSANIGELPIGVPNNLIPIITQTAIGKRPKVTVFGNDYPTPDGTCIRDYIHVVDLAKAHVIALERLLNNRNKSNFEIFNLGTGNGFSVMQVINTFEKVSGRKLNYVIGDRRPGDVIQIFADTKFANEELGWKAEETLEEMVSSAWAWEQNIPKIYGDKFNK